MVIDNALYILDRDNDLQYSEQSTWILSVVRLKLVGHALEVL